MDDERPQNHGGGNGRWSIIVAIIMLAAFGLPFLIAHECERRDEQNAKGRER